MAAVAILSALPDELEQISRSVRVTSRICVAGVEFTSGELQGIEVVLALAGMGKVNAAFAATIMLDRFGCQSLIFSGVAGSVSPDLEAGDVLIGTRLVQHDYGALVDGVFWPAEPGELPLPQVGSRHAGYQLPKSLVAKLEPLIADLQLPAFGQGKTRRTPKVRLGAILTGDIFLSCARTREALRELHGGDVVEMEGAAVAQLAAKFNAPFIAIRTVSDSASEGSLLDFQSTVKLAAANSAALAVVLAPLLAREVGSLA